MLLMSPLLMIVQNFLWYCMFVAHESYSILLYLTVFKCISRLPFLKVHKKGVDNNIVFSQWTVLHGCILQPSILNRHT